MNNLVKRLQEMAIAFRDGNEGSDTALILDEAAARIEKLEASLKIISEFRARHGEADVPESKMAEELL